MQFIIVAGFSPESRPAIIYTFALRTITFAVASQKQCAADKQTRAYFAAAADCEELRKLPKKKAVAQREIMRANLNERKRMRKNVIYVSISFGSLNRMICPPSSNDYIFTCVSYAV